MRLPRRVDIVGKSYTVHVERRPVRNPGLDQRPLSGCAIYSAREIHIDGTKPADYQREVLTHEIVHAVDAATIDDENMLEERDIHRIAQGIDYVLSHNPKLVDLYTKAPK